MGKALFACLVFTDCLSNGRVGLRLLLLFFRIQFLLKLLGCWTGFNDLGLMILWLFVGFLSLECFRIL